MKIMKSLRHISLSLAAAGMLMLCSAVYPELYAGHAWAADEAGSVIALKGKASIERNGKTLNAVVRDSVLLQDAVSTYEASRVKILFRDDSILTLGEKSRVSVREFVQGKEKGNKAIFNLIDGKMRSVVGRDGFEVRTPTAVAAARGTVILCETGMINGNKFTTILAYEGEVGLQSTDPKITGNVVLSPGMVLTVVEGEPLGAPGQASREMIRRMLLDTDFAGQEITVPEAMLLDFGGIGLFVDIPQLPPISQPGTSTTTPVHVLITFP